MTIPYSLDYTVVEVELALARATLAAPSTPATSRRAGRMAYWLLCGLIAGLCVRALFRDRFGLFPGLAVALGAALVWGRFMVQSRQRQRQSAPLHGLAAGPCRVVVAESGLYWIHAGIPSRIDIDRSYTVDESAVGCILNGTQGPVLWIPASAFPDQPGAAALRGALAEWINGSAVPAGAARSRPRPFWQGYRANLWSGLCSLVLLQLRQPLDSRPRQWVALALTLLITTGCWQWAIAGVQAQFNPAAIAGLLFVLPALLFASVCATSLSRQHERMADLVTLGLGACLFTEPICRVLAGLPGVSDLFGRIVPQDAIGPTLNALWLSLIVAASLWQRTRPITLRVGPALLCCAIVLAASLALVPYDDALWLAPAESGDTAANQVADDATSPDEAAVDYANEERIYREASVLDQALGRLTPARGDRINLYFVGFAGTSTQDVFMKEVRSVAKLFAERFEGATHSVLLINNPATLDIDPIATRTALAATLEHIGTLIDPQRDIVFVYLTSHGSPDHSFSVSNPPLALSDIYPSDLRRMLDDARIRNRIVVVSACFSGGFIDPLKTDFSVVMTAAAADRSSFGCSNEEDFTYFGRAYFDEGLRRTTSFVEAFRLAQPRIAAREAEQGFLPSQPQLFVGARIGPILQRFQRQLQGQPSLAQALHRAAPN